MHTYVNEILYSKPIKRKYYVSVDLLRFTESFVHLLEAFSARAVRTTRIKVYFRNIGDLSRIPTMNHTITEGIEMTTAMTRIVPI
jgi:hypothetical protein